MTTGSVDASELLAFTHFPLMSAVASAWMQAKANGTSLQLTLLALALILLALRRIVGPPHGRSPSSPQRIGSGSSSSRSELSHI